MKSIKHALLNLNRYAFFLFLLFCPLLNYSQGTLWVESQRIKASLLPTGTLFWDGKKATYYAPKESKANTLSALSLWMGGINNSDGKLHLAAQTYKEMGKDYQVGPLKLNGDYDSAFSADYNKIFTITRLEIDSHRLGLSTSQNIINWPGNLDDSKGYAKRLAPFVDVNNNGVYDPLNGDYPDVKGDIAFWWVNNDNTAHKESGGLPLKVEIHNLAYAYLCPDNNLLGSSLFIEYKIINRSGVSYDDFYTGVWADFDIGNPHNDYIGTDTNLQSIYGYNSERIDSGTFGLLGQDTLFFKGYQKNLPVQSISFPYGLKNGVISTPLYAVMPIFNSLNTTPQGKPIAPPQFYNFLRGFWKDSNPLTSSGTGYGGGSTQTKFAFSGNPITNIGWSEKKEKNINSDRSVIASFKTAKFNPSDTLILSTVLQSHITNSDSIQIGLNLAFREVEELQKQIKQGAIIPCRTVSSCSGSAQCVWPGDADNNKVVNEQDIFRIGYAFGTSGTPRSIVSIGFEGQQATDFGKSFPDGLDYKYADTNGDGVIDEKDVQAILSNFSLTHNKKEAPSLKRSSSANIYLEVQEDTAKLGQVITIIIRLGDGSLVPQNIYGFSFSINFDNQIIDSSSIEVDSKGWVTVDGKFIGMVKHNPSNGKTIFGFVRNDGIGKTDTGKLIVVKYVITDNISGGFKPIINFELTDVKVVDTKLNDIPVVISNDSLNINNTNIEQISKWLSDVKLYPNPADNQFNIATKNIKIDRVEIYDFTGRRVWYNYPTTTVVNLTTENLISGVYLIKISSGLHITYKKLIVSH